MNSLVVKSGKAVNFDTQEELHKRYYTLESQLYHSNYNQKPAAQTILDTLHVGCKRITWLEHIEGEAVQVVVTSYNTYRVNGFSYKVENFDKLKEVLDLQ